MPNVYTQTTAIAFELIETGKIEINFRINYFSVEEYQNQMIKIN
jgi:hypothetical protein